MENSENKYHIPVMLNECLEGLKINPDGVYVDVTFGGGGHSKAIYEQLSPKGKLIVFDQDPDAKKMRGKLQIFSLLRQTLLFYPIIYAF